MDESHLFQALLQPTIAYALHAQGFRSTKRGCVDQFTAVASAYMKTLTETVARNAEIANRRIPSEADFLAALAVCGVFGDEMAIDGGKHLPDLGASAVSCLVNWIDGRENEELVRVANKEKSTPSTEPDSYLETIKRQPHSGSAQLKQKDKEAKFAGTILGEPRSQTILLHRNHPQPIPVNYQIWVPGDDHPNNQQRVQPHPRESMNSTRDFF